MKAYQKTKYPKMYGDAYWGWFDAEKSPESVTDEIINNRNEFIEVYKITKSCYLRSVDVFRNPRYFDHLETYRDVDGRIYVLCSNYDNGEINEVIVQYGFHVQPCMYVANATTYLRIFANVKQLKEFCQGDIKTINSRVI